MTNLQIYDALREMVIAAEGDGWDMSNAHVLNAARDALAALSEKLGVVLDVDGGVLRS